MGKKGQTSSKTNSNNTKANLEVQKIFLKEVLGLNCEICEAVPIDCKSKTSIINDDGIFDKYMRWRGTSQYAFAYPNHYGGGSRNNKSSKNIKKNKKSKKN